MQTYKEFISQKHKALQTQSEEIVNEQIKEEKIVEPIHESSKKEDIIEKPEEIYFDPAFLKPQHESVQETVYEEEIVHESDYKIDPLAYQIFRDKTETFECKIAVEGSDTKNTAVRLLLESDEWNVFFPGKIVNGVCNIPMKKLSILSPGSKGVIKIEVIVEGEIFYPWYERFQVQNSKNVKVEVVKKIQQPQSRTSVKIIS